MPQQKRFVQFTHRVRLLITLLFAVYMVACSSSPSTFTYQVRVEDKVTGRPISHAKVTIEVGGIAPLVVLSDGSGLAAFDVDISRSGKSSRVIVEASQYKTFDQNINLDQNRLPQPIQLEPNAAVAPTQPATEAPTTPATDVPTATAPATATNTAVPATATATVVEPTATPIDPTPPSEAPADGAPVQQIFSAQGVPDRTSKRVSVTIVKVEREGSLVQVAFVAVNEGQSYATDICSSGCRLIDSNGMTFTQQKVSAEGRIGDYLYDKIIPSRAPYRFSVSFEGVAADVQQIALLEVRGFGVEGPLEFRNIPVPYTLDAANAPPWAGSIATDQLLQVIGTPGRTAKPLSVTIVKVEREGSLVQVTFVAANEGQSYATDICSSGCRLIDPTGETFKQQKVSAEGRSGDYLYDKIIPSQAPYRFTLFFEGVAADIQRVELLEVRGFGVNGPLELRNVPIPYTLDSASVLPWTDSIVTDQILRVIGTPDRTSKQLSMTIVNVEREGSLVKVTLVAVNEGPSYTTDICSSGCRLIDPTGETFKQQKVSAEGRSGDYLYDKSIPSQTSYRFTLFFEGVAADVQQITLLEVRGFGVEGPLEFRNIPVPYQQ